MDSYQRVLRANRLIDKAKEYEKAEAEGRLIMLPCKVGDTVYIHGEPVKISFIHIENEITFCVYADCCNRDDCGMGCPFYEDDISWEGEHECKSNGYLEFKVDDIGKTVFLTREEAEQALKNGGTEQ